MSSQTLQLPTIQNWNCHSCGDCCKKHLVEITEEERQRILKQNWTEADGIPADQKILVKDAGPVWNRRYRLGHQPEDGACVFLTKEGLCRIHAKFGEPAKPLACRVYPYALHPAGKKITVSLRFSCPSVVNNLGQSVSDQRSSLNQLAQEVVPPGAGSIQPPGVNTHQQVKWPDFLRFVEALDVSLAEPGVPIRIKLLRALFWMGLVNQSKFDSVLGNRLTEFLDIIREAATAEIDDSGEQPEEPSRIGRVLFRLLVAQYARNDTLSNAGSGMRGRLRLLSVALQFTRGSGIIPPLQEIFTPVPFAAVEQPFGGITAEADEILTRYFRVKVQGLQFCGRAYFDIPLVEGFQSLALIYPSVLWLARWLAVGEGRDSLTTNDVARSLAIADHYHAYSPSFGKSNFRKRVQMLANLGDISKLCTWYSR